MSKPHEPISMDNLLFSLPRFKKMVDGVTDIHTNVDILKDNPLPERNVQLAKAEIFQRLSATMLDLSEEIQPSTVAVYGALLEFMTCIMYSVSIIEQDMNEVVVNSLQQVVPLALIKALGQSHIVPEVRTPIEPESLKPKI